MGIDHDDHLDIHHLPHPPKRVHDLARLHRIALFDGNDTAVMKDTFKRHIDIDDFRLHLLQQRKKDALCRLCKITVFHRRLSNDG